MSNQVKKPWPLYFMALWAFFGIGSFLSAMSRSLFQENESLLQMTSLAVLGVAILLVYFLAKFNRKSLLVFGVLSVLLAVFQIFNIARILITEGYTPVIFFLLYYIVPSIVLAWLAFSKRYADLSLKYMEYVKQEDMRKASLKAMGR